MNLDILKSRTRRHFFRDCGVGVGKMALASLMVDRALASPSAGSGQALGTHFPGKAKRVIYLFMAGAPAAADPARPPIESP